MLPLLIKKKLLFFPHKYIKGMLFLLVSFLVVWYLLPFSFKTPFGLIDDHSIMYYLGEDKKITLSEIPRLLLSTEIGRFGNFERFRPSYFLLQIIESFIWGDSPLLWYLARIVFLTASIAIAWYLVSMLIGWLPAFFFTLFILTYEYWADIWARLGPAEIYAVFGTSLFFLGFVFALNDLRSKKGSTKAPLWWPPLVSSIGLIIASGSKENFLVLTLPAFFLLVKYAMQKKKLILPIALLFLSLAYGALIVLAVFLATGKSGHDIYNAEISPIGRLSLVIAGSRLYFEKIRASYVLGLVLFLTVLIYPTKSLFRKYFAIVWKLLAATAAMFAVFISQYVFYNGNYPTNIRYDFPGMLVEPFFLLAALLFVYNVLKLLYLPFKIEEWSKFILLLFLALTVMRGFGHIRSMSLLNYQRSQSFSRNLQTLVGGIKDNPNAVLVFDSYLTSDYEPIFSVQRYLRSYSINREMYLRIHNYSEEQGVSSLEQSLSLELYNYSQKGSQKEGFTFKPIKTLQNGECISIIFSLKKKPSYSCPIVYYL